MNKEKLKEVEEMFSLVLGRFNDCCKLTKDNYCNVSYDNISFEFVYFGNEGSDSLLKIGLSNLFVRYSERGIFGDTKLLDVVCKNLKQIKAKILLTLQKEIVSTIDPLQKLLNELSNDLIDGGVFEEKGEEQETKFNVGGMVQVLYNYDLHKKGLEEKWYQDEETGEVIYFLASRDGSISVNEDHIGGKFIIDSIQGDILNVKSGNKEIQLQLKKV